MNYEIEVAACVAGPIRYVRGFSFPLGDKPQIRKAGQRFAWRIRRGILHGNQDPAND